MYSVISFYTVTLVNRRDKENKRYIGAVCGLGPDINGRHSAFPDHDMEITFDVKITNKDISTVCNTYNRIFLSLLIMNLANFNMECCALLH